MPIPQILLAASKLPFVGKLISAFIPNFRLVVEYLLIAAVITIGGATLHLWQAKKLLTAKNETLTERMSSLANEVAVQDSTIKMLSSAREKDERAFRALMTENQRLDALTAANRKRLQELESQNEEVRKYLRTRIPPELACLLNNSCGASGDKDGSSSTIAKPSGKVQPR
jgi:hypothetical protein